MIIEEKAVAHITQIVINKMISNLGMLIIYGFVIITILNYVANFFQWGWDDTDGIDRSGLTPYTDCKTGVQYLSIGGSAPTVRVDTSGTPVVDFKDCF